jgi:hypothetical protein
MRAQAMTGEGLYQPPALVPREPVIAAAHPTAGSAERVSDPHDRSDPGPSNFLDDPVFWTVAIACLATGVVGVKFDWFKGGGSVSVRMSDELAHILGNLLFTIAGIVVFKVAVSKLEIPGLQKVAAAI